MIGSVAVSLGLGLSIARRSGRDPAAVVAALCVLAIAPIPALSVGLLAVAVFRFRRTADATRRERAVETAALEVSELIGLGLAGGLSVAASIEHAREHGPVEAGPELSQLLVRIDRSGVAPALAAEGGHLASTCAVLVTATASGAPVLPALEAHVRQEHHRRHTAAVEVARRLPIRLLVPLTLLVLPGFVLIAVGPAVIDSLARLSP